MKWPERDRYLRSLKKTIKNHQIFTGSRQPEGGLSLIHIYFMSVSSYGSGTESSGVVKIIKDLDEPLEGKDVLIVEDIIDSGRTLSYLIEVLKQRNPATIQLCTLLDKPERRVKKQVQVQYTCFTIPDEFVVGYGLDYDQHYRNLPYIGVIEK